MKSAAVLAASILALSAMLWAADDAVIAPQTGATIAPITNNVVSSGDAVNIPKAISYQGRLTDAAGKPVPDGSHSVAFKLYAVPEGGSPFWREAQNVTTREGMFSVLLGSVTPISTGISVEAAYLGMAVEGDAEMTPRLRIAGTASTTEPAVGQSPRGGTDADDAWVRIGSDSVLYTIRRLGIVRGGSSNKLYGIYGYTQTIFGSSCTTGASGANVGNIAIGGGYGNRAWAPFTAVCGGRNNKAGNEATDTSAIVVGGFGNQANAKFSYVASGLNNTANGVGAAIGGGQDNRADNYYSTIGGGLYNRAQYNNFGTIAGGDSNCADDFAATVGGGRLNTAYNPYATVAGGDGNTASGYYASIGGGYHNTANGNYSTVPGGSQNIASGTYAFAAGRRAQAAHTGSFVWADGTDADFTSTDTHQFLVRAANGVGVYSSIGSAFYTNKPAQHCFHADTGAASYTAFYVDTTGYNGYAVEHSGYDGFWVTTAANRGVYVGNAGTYGAYVNSNDARGGYFRNNNNDYYALTAWNNTGTGGTVRGLYVQGHGYATGGWQSYLDGGGRGYGVVSPAMGVMAWGTGKLVNGRASIGLEKTFRDAVSADVPLKVIVTPNSMCNGICVTERSAGGFLVAELADGVSSAGFDWIAIGRPKGEQPQGAAPVMTDVPPDRDGAGAGHKPAQGE